MTPLLTINLLRVLFITFATCVGLMIGDETLGSAGIGAGAGAACGFGAAVCDGVDPGSGSGADGDGGAAVERGRHDLVRA